MSSSYNNYSYVKFYCVLVSGCPTGRDINVTTQHSIGVLLHLRTPSHVISNKRPISDSRIGQIRRENRDSLGSVWSHYDDQISHYERLFENWFEHSKSMLLIGRSACSRSRFTTLSVYSRSHTLLCILPNTLPNTLSKTLLYALLYALCAFDLCPFDLHPTLSFPRRYICIDIGLPRRLPGSLGHNPPLHFLHLGLWGLLNLGRRSLLARLLVRVPRTLGY